MQKLLKRQKVEGIEITVNISGVEEWSREDLKEPETDVHISTPQPSLQIATPFNQELPSFNDPAIIRKMCEFHNSLLSLPSSCCSVSVYGTFSLYIC